MGASWKIAGASVIGSSHQRSGGRCEDSWSFSQCDDLENDCIAICVSDGAGSAVKGWVGAKAASKLVCRWLISAFDALHGSDDPGWRKSLWRDVRKPLERMSMISRSDLRDYACTVVSCAVHSDGRWVVVHIGDGAVVGRLESGFSILSAPVKGEHANETYFLTDKHFQRNMKVIKGCKSEERGELTGCALFSDGLEGSLINKRDGTVAPAIAHMLAWLDSRTSSEVAPAVEENLVKVFRPLTTDDCTLVLAVKTA